MGMAHRGRLNVLVNILGKSPEMLFAEFEGNLDEQNPLRSGDVKYHLGFASDIQTPGGPVHMAMAFNPSHLEIVDPVVLGSARARQLRRMDTNHDKVMPILIHGDASFSGQGVVMELFQMSQTRGFAVGGTAGKPAFHQGGKVRTPSGNEIVFGLQGFRVHSFVKTHHSAPGICLGDLGWQSHQQKCK